jgi:hypothetical protein
MNNPKTFNEEINEADKRNIVVLRTANDKTFLRNLFSFHSAVKEA